MKLSKLAIGLSLALGFVGLASAQTVMKISISIAQNSHPGIAIDTFGKEVEKRTVDVTRFSRFTQAHWAASVNPLKRFNWERTS